MIECVICCDSSGPFGEAPGFGYVCEDCVEKYNLLCFSGFETKDEIESKVLWNKHAHNVISVLQNKPK